jgi:signal transduction histidine kinase
MRAAEKENVMSTERILIVDDVPTNRKILEIALEAEGYETRAASNGVEAVEMALEWLPDLVLLDVSMPQRDGFEACEILKATENTADISIIFLTARVGVTEVAKAFHMGGADYITKPFHMGEVIARVRVHMRLHRVERELEEAHVERLQSAKLESIGQLAAGVAHEINTPTQWVSDNTRFLQESFLGLGPLVAKARDLATLVQAGGDANDSAEELLKLYEDAEVEYLSGEIPTALSQSLEGLGRVTKIVQALKEFSNPGSREEVDCDLNKAVECTVLVCSNEWKYVANLALELEPGLPLVRCLRGQLNQVVMNLIINAAQAIAEKVAGGDQDKGKITITTRRDGDYVEIRIADTGIGIPSEVCSKVFDPFFSTRDVGKGSGQGLFVARNVVVQRHAGTLEFETAAGEGTTFVVRLPLTQRTIDSAA